MSERIIAPKLKKGDGVRVIAPSFSASIFRPDLLKKAEATLGEMGLKVTYPREVLTKWGQLSTND